MFKLQNSAVVLQKSNACLDQSRHQPILEERVQAKHFFLLIKSVNNAPNRLWTESLNASNRRNVCGFKVNNKQGKI